MLELEKAQRIINYDKTSYSIIFTIIVLLELLSLTINKFMIILSRRMIQLLTGLLEPTPQSSETKININPKFDNSHNQGDTNMSDESKSFFQFPEVTTE